VAGIARWGDLVAGSSLIESAPIGGPVVILDSTMGPRVVLERCLEIEAALGRERRERWGPRLIDLDVLVAGSLVVDEPGLRIPHPRMLERRFVLEPLLEAWPDAAVPGCPSVRERLAAVADQEVGIAAPAGWWR
jgi:2-amino-4-hydroxy-6-hydroxymethyldihydropteridine diphosphokinase